MQSKYAHFFPGETNFVWKKTLLQLKVKQISNEASGRRKEQWRSVGANINLEEAVPKRKVPKFGHISIYKVAKYKTFGSKIL